MDLGPILDFLRDLKAHNDREWFQSQTTRWHHARDQFKAFVETLLDSLSESAPAWAGHDAADCIFRLHRDLRFAKDKSPYKTNVSAFFSAAGRSVHDPGFYVSLEPDGKSMLAAGLYQPTPGELSTLRAAIAADARPLRQILAAAKLRKAFPDGLNGEKSKTVRGYRPDHPAWDLLQIKSLIVWREFSDHDIQNGTFAKLARPALQSSLPLCEWLDHSRRSRS